MRTFVIAAGFAILSPVALAQEATIAAPKAPVANYDPTMSAKEAVLANWELAAAGIRAGKIVGSNVVGLAEGGTSYAGLAQQAHYAQKTMVQRYNAALWVYTPGSGVAPAAPATFLTDAVAASEAPCDTGDCAAERAAILETFTHASVEMGKAADAATAALKAREGLSDAVLMSEHLSLMAAYLASEDWAADYTLTAFGRDGEEVAARIVGTMSLWRNIEPYVGLTDPELDKSINAAVTDLLRTLRRHTRAGSAMDADSPALVEIKAAAQVLAQEFQRAAALFTA